MRTQIVSRVISDAPDYRDEGTFQFIVIPDANLAVGFQEGYVHVTEEFPRECTVVREIDVSDEFVENARAFLALRRALDSAIRSYLAHA